MATPAEHRSHSTPAEYCEYCDQETRDIRQHVSSIPHIMATKPTVSDMGANITLPFTSPGYQMMLRGGWSEGAGLGPTESGTIHPVKTVLKHDTRGLGFTRGTDDTSTIPRVTHFKPFDLKAIKRKPQDPVQAPRDIADESKRRATELRRSFMDSHEDY